MYRVRSNLHNIIVVLLDMLSVICSLLLANFIRHYNYVNFHVINDAVLALLSILIISYFILYFIINFNDHFINKGILHEFWDVLKMNLSMIAIAMVIIYFTRVIQDFSRLVLIYFCIIDILMMLVLHALLRKAVPYIIKQTSGLRRLLIVSSQEHAADLLEHVWRSGNYSYLVDSFAFTDYVMSSHEEALKINGIPVAADIFSLVSYCQTASIDEVLFSLTLNEITEYEAIIAQISSMGIAVHISVDLFFKDITSSKLLTKFGDYNAITYADKFLSLRQLMLKRSLDILGGVTGMLLLIPITILLAPIIKIESPGPVLFSQNRVGRNGRLFKIYKFRSMYLDAEMRKQELMTSNEMSGLMFKMENDPRITRIGKFIRKTSLDEFPQFWNVLRGDMSLVGTRPPTLDEFKQYEAHHKKRLSITPGLTGLWQVNGRNQVTDFEEVVKMDVKYIEEWSFGLDIKILLKTIAVVCRGKGAE